MRGKKKTGIIFSVVVICILAAAVAFALLSKGKEHKSSKEAAAKKEEAVPPYYMSPYLWTEVNKDVLVCKGSYASVNSTVVVSGKEATVIDTGASTAEGQRIKDYLENKKLTLKNIIVTHEHEDHNYNVRLLKTDKVKYYTYNNCKDGQIIKMGDKEFKIIHTPGHFNNMHMSVELVKEHILIAGDVVVTNMPSVVSYGGNSKDLLDTLNKIKESNYSKIIPGHGKVIDPKLAVDRQIKYLNKIREAVLKTIDSNGKCSQIVNMEKEQFADDCSDYDMGSFDEVHGGNIATIFDELSKLKK